MEDRILDSSLKFPFKITVRYFVSRIKILRATRDENTRNSTCYAFNAMNILYVTC